MSDTLKKGFDFSRCQWFQFRAPHGRCTLPHGHEGEHVFNAKKPRNETVVHPSGFNSHDVHVLKLIREHALDHSSPDIKMTVDSLIDRIESLLGGASKVSGIGGTFHVAL